MKTISIGDLHGRTDWQSINFSNYDKVIFIGDYVDSYDKTDEEIISNLKNIINLKKSDPDKFILLLGNHDIQYLWLPNFRCAGFRLGSATALRIIFNEHRSLFQIAYQLNNYIWSHAGLSNNWFNKHSEHFVTEADTMAAWNKLLSPDEFNVKFPLPAKPKTLADRINEISNSSLNWILHEVGAKRGGLRYDIGGPTWADRSETQIDHLKHYHQIVGHTPISTISTFGDEKSSITYIDCLGKSTIFYEKEICVTQTN